MIDQLLSSVSKELLPKLGEYGLSGPQANKAVDLAKSSVFDVFKKEAAGGDITNILNLFNGKQQISSSPLVGNLINTYAGELFAKLGVEKKTADSIAKFAIPFIMQMIDKKTPASGVPQSDLLSMLGKGGGILGQLGQLGKLFRS